MKLLMPIALLMLTVSLAVGATGINFRNESSKKEIEAYKSASIELNQFARSLQLNGEEIPRSAQEQNGLEILWNERLFCYAAPEYEATALDVRVLCQLLYLFKLRADEANEKLPEGPIMYLAFAQRKELISQPLAQLYNEKVNKYKIYYNSGKSSFDSLTDPLPWLPIIPVPAATPEQFSDSSTFLTTPIAQPTPAYTEPTDEMPADRSNDSLPE